MTSLSVWTVSDIKMSGDTMAWAWYANVLAECYRASSWFVDITSSLHWKWCCDLRGGKDIISPCQPVKPRLRNMRPQPEVLHYSRRSSLSQFPQRQFGPSFDAVEKWGFLCFPIALCHFHVPPALSSTCDLLQTCFAAISETRISAKLSKVELGAATWIGTFWFSWCYPHSNHFPWPW